MSPAVQTILVALIGLFFAWRAFARYAPKAAWRLQASLSYACERRGRPAWLQSVGRALRPRKVRSGDGCGSGCNTCGGCATVSPPDQLPMRSAAPATSTTSAAQPTHVAA